VFRIIEQSSSTGLSFGFFPSRTRAETLQGASVEECMEWTIMLREIIATVRK
jgi:hypothetical protein